MDAPAVIRLAAPTLFHMIVCLIQTEIGLFPGVRIMDHFKWERV